MPYLSPQRKLAVIVHHALVACFFLVASSPLNGRLEMGISESHISRPHSPCQADFALGQERPLARIPQTH